MKLHLPTALRGALVACCLAAPAAFADDLPITASTTALNDGQTHAYDAITLQGEASTLNVNTGTTVTGASLIAANSGAGNSFINIGSSGAAEDTAKSLLWITSQDTNLSQVSYRKSGFLRLSHYKNKTTTLNIYSDGELRATGAVVSTADDGNSVTNISGGEMNVRGLWMKTASSSIINMSSGKLNLGAYGIKANEGGTITLTGGDLGALDAAGWTSAIGLTMGNTTIQTNVYTYDDAAADWAGYTGNGADIIISGKLTTTAANTLAGSGSLTISNTLDHAINLANGATATLKLSDLADFESYFTDGATQGRTSIALVMNGESNLENVTCGDATYNLIAEDGKSYIDTGVTNYAILSGTATYDTTTATSEEAFSGVNKILLSGGTLDMQTGLTGINGGIQVKTTNSAASPVISLADNVTLNSSDLEIVSGNTVQLAGSGTYTMSDSATAHTGLSAANSWTGTVVIGGGTSALTLAGQNYNSLCTSPSTIVFNGVKGHLEVSGSSATSAPHTANFKLTDNGNIAALTISDGSSGKYYNFSGNFSGDGSFVRAGTWTADCHFHFSGNVSEWTGDFSNTINGKSYLHFTGNATTLNMDLDNTSTTKQMTVNIDNANAVTVTGDIKGNTAVNYTLAGNKTVSSEASSYTGATSVSAGTVTLASEKALGNSSATTVAEGATLAVQKGVEAVSLNADTNAITISEGATFALQNGVAITGALTLADGATLDITGFDLSASTFSGGTAVVATTGTLSVGNIALEGLQSGVAASLSTEDNTLMITELTSMGITGVVGGSYDGTTLTFTTNLDVTNLYGDVTFSLDGLTSGQLGVQVFNEVGDWDAMLQLSFQNTSGETIRLDGVTSLTLNNYSGENFSVSADGLSVGTYAAYMIPEPTTATLSLLALAGLAARRRRK